LISPKSPTHAPEPRAKNSSTAWTQPDDRVDGSRHSATGRGRTQIEGETVELLGPDGLRGDPKTISGLKTFQAAGGSQALRRTEVVLVSLDDGEPVAVRRPSLLGAILIKARVLVKKRERKYESDREDLVRLLTYVENARALTVGMSRKEPRWLRDAQAVIDFEDPVLSAQFREGSLDRARQALRILAQESSYSESSTK
jgi:hypothetical protein